MLQLIAMRHELEGCVKPEVMCCGRITEDFPVLTNRGRLNCMAPIH
jgi:hypothetical protein